MNEHFLERNVTKVEESGILYFFHFFIRFHEFMHSLHAFLYDSYICIPASVSVSASASAYHVTIPTIISLCTFFFHYLQTFEHIALECIRSMPRPISHSFSWKRKKKSVFFFRFTNHSHHISIFEVENIT